jgi:asparaginyl-tRNA synthetase
LAKLKGIVGSQFAYGLRRADRDSRTVEREIRVPGALGVDLQSEHERYLTEKYAKKPVIAMNYRKSSKAFYMRLNDDDRRVATPILSCRASGAELGKAPAK